MPATPITAASRYFRRGTTKVSFCPTISNKSAPTRSELNAGTDLSNEVAEIEGWMVASGTIDTPSLGTRFNAKIDGEITADDSSLMFYASSDSVDVRSLQPRGTNGFIVWLDEGDVAGRKMDVFPVRVTATPKERNMDGAARIQVQYAITSEPAENVTIPA